MREMKSVKVGMQGMGLQCECEESAWECLDMAGIVKSVRDQGGDAENEGGNFSITLEMI